MQRRWQVKTVLDLESERTLTQTDGFGLALRTLSWDATEQACFTFVDGIALFRQRVLVDEDPIAAWKRNTSQF